ncbi:MAG: FAD-dependent oxidoreductase [Patescibacteria group bacterium]
MNTGNIRSNTFPTSVTFPEVTIELVRTRFEYGDISTFIFKSEESISFKAGQYVHLRLSNVASGHKAVREFSFASVPGEKEIWFSVNTRSGSPYQVALRALVPGNKASLFKIKGEMVVPEDLGAHIVLIAHGVGMAPFRAILHDAHARDLNVDFTLVQVDKEKYLYEEEIRELSYEQHRITRVQLGETLEGVIQKHPGAYFFLAGSLSFVESIKGKLIGRGVSVEKIKTDIFKGLTDDF